MTWDEGSSLRASPFCAAISARLILLKGLEALMVRSSSLFALASARSFFNAFRDPLWSSLGRGFVALVVTVIISTSIVFCRFSAFECLWLRGRFVWRTLLASSLLFPFHFLHFSPPHFCNGALLAQVKTMHFENYTCPLQMPLPIHLHLHPLNRLLVDFQRVRCCIQEVLWSTQ